MGKVYSMYNRTMVIYGASSIGLHRLYRVHNLLRVHRLLKVQISVSVIVTIMLHILCNTSIVTDLSQKLFIVKITSISQ